VYVCQTAQHGYKHRKGCKKVTETGTWIINPCFNSSRPVSLSRTPNPSCTKRSSQNLFSTFIERDRKDLHRDRERHHRIVLAPEMYQLGLCERFYSNSVSRRGPAHKEPSHQNPCAPPPPVGSTNNIGSARFFQKLIFYMVTRLIPKLLRLLWLFSRIPIGSEGDWWGTELTNSALSDFS